MEGNDDLQDHLRGANARDIYSEAHKSYTNSLSAHKLSIGYKKVLRSDSKIKLLASAGSNSL